MKFLDLNSDILAIKCIKSHVFLGIGCTLYVLSEKNCEVKFKINVIHPDNIHGIIIKSDNKLIIYGGKSLCILDLIINHNFVSIEQIKVVHRFEDWIINVKWLGSSMDPLTILFAHNNVYNLHLCNKQYSNTYCKETCLLYSGSISGPNYENAIIFSGTVFQEILIWRLTKNKYSEVLHRLKGHKGVIFSVFYNPLTNFICSTSDDRTVRLWKVLNNFSSDRRTTTWENVEISLQITMYGHLARVWKAVQFKNIIASIGEDSRICFWSLTGELLHKIEAHQGAPIWCIDISQDDIIFTGGGNGSINSWPLEIFSSRLHNYMLIENKEIFPKYVTFIDNSDILIYSYYKNSSKILHFSTKNFQLLNSFDLPEFFASYCIMELSANRQFIAFASIKGEIILYKKIGKIWNQIGKYKIIDSKIISIQWLAIDTILICITEGILYVIKFLTHSIQILSKHVLPPCRERWITSACMCYNLLICGDRMGSMFIYNLQNNTLNPVQSFKNIHSRFGVQSCTIMNYNLITTGRDGVLRFYKFYNINSKNPMIKFLNVKTMPMDWVSRLLKNKNDYYVLGFKEEEFILYSLSLKQILVKIPCGGGHRSWDCMLYNGLINFIYIQKKQAYVVKVPLKPLVIPSFMNGFHTKQIYSIKILKTSKYNILISGSEDCTLAISYVDSKSQMKLNFIDSFYGHLSSIRCISIFTLLINKNMSKNLIFSGGGRAQLKIWEMIVKTNKCTISNEDIFCKDLLTHMLHRSDKERNKIWIGKEFIFNIDTETRYMDICTIENPKSMHSILIFIACSDGCLRSYNYNIVLNKIKLIDTLVYKNRCILKVHSFMHQENILLITMATDGLLNLWNIVPIKDTLIIRQIKINGNNEFSLHQSGINCFDLKILNNYEYILATGGDDNLLNVLIFKIMSNENEVVSIQIVSLWKTTSIHSAQVTGVKLLNKNKIISVGVDQKLVIHKYFYSDSEISVIFLKEINLCISDVQGITFCENQKLNSQIFCVYGKGFQLLEL